MVRCPCCKQPWRAAPGDRLPLFELRRLAFAYVIRQLDVTEAELTSRRKNNRLTEARALFVWVCKAFGNPLDASYARIGRWLDKNHTSIMHLWSETIPRLRAEDVDFERLCDRFAAFAFEHQETTPCN